MRRVVAFTILLWLAFWAGGVAMHRACVGASVNHLGWTDVAGYDTEAYVGNYTIIFEIMNVNHRHPLNGLMMSPVYAVGGTVREKAGEEPAKVAVLGCFALFGAASFLLLWIVMARLGAPFVNRLAAAALWLSFAHVWILGGCAESFGVSQALLLGTVLMVAVGVRDARAWIAMSIVAGGVTVTNAVKPLAAWIVAADGWRWLKSLNRRAVLLVLAGGVGAVVLAAGFLLVKWEFVDGIGTLNGIAITVRQVTDCLSTDMPIARRLWLAWNAFWCEPMVVRESVIARSYITTGYGSFVPHVACTAVLMLSAWGAVRNFRVPAVRAALAMVAFDVALHVIVGWGVEEGQIYCGHWFWVVPLLVALLPPRAAWLVFPLAALIALENLAVVW